MEEAIVSKIEHLGNSGFGFLAKGYQLNGGDGEAFNIWDGNNVAVDTSYSIMCILFLAQAVYASIRSARIAL